MSKWCIRIHIHYISSNVKLYLFDINAYNILGTASFKEEVSIFKSLQ